MSQTPRPRVLLSECLGIRPVRHDGNMVFDSFVEVLKKYVDVLPVCPEVSLGLGVPRSPLVLYEESGRLELLDTKTGTKYTKNMEELAKSILSNLVVDGVILKSASPSCGVGDAKVYGPGRRVVRRGDGLFTSAVRSYMRCVPVESERRLYAHDIRVRFLTKIFALAELRETLSNLRTSEELVDFHRRFKYLIMLHNQTALKNLGRLVANREKYSLEELTDSYRKKFIEALCANPTRKSYVNVFTHMYGHLKKLLNQSERKYVLYLIESYASDRESLKTVMAYFRGFIHRFGDSYLAEQRLLSPYPEELDQTL
ncbi:MAG: DUF523 and DUF1722 domain-containing protein [Sulfolobales archaeon]